MTNEEAKEWLKAIEEKYIYGGDEGFDAKRKEAISMAIKALSEQEPCEDVISRQAVLDLTGKSDWFESSDDYNDFVIAVCELPPVNPQEPKTIQEKQAESEKYQKAFDDGYDNGYAQARFDYEPKTGHWIYKGYYECSECGKSTYLDKPNYCMNCGAKME